MAFGFVQTVQSSVTSTSLTITLPAPATANNLLVLNLKFTSAPASIVVVDNATIPNTYASAFGPYTASGFSAYQFYGVQTTGGATTVTITWPTSIFLRATIDEFSGGATSNAAVFDTTSRNFGSGTSGNVASFSPASTGELIVVGVSLATGGTFTAGTGYTAATSATAQSTMYKLSSAATETAPSSWVNSVSWSELAGAYKPPTTVINNGGGGNSRTASLSIAALARL